MPLANYLILYIMTRPLTRLRLTIALQLTLCSGPWLAQTTGPSMMFGDPAGRLRHRPARHLVRRALPALLFETTAKDATGADHWGIPTAVGSAVSTTGVRSPKLLRRLTTSRKACARRAH